MLKAQLEIKVINLQTTVKSLRAKNDELESEIIGVKQIGEQVGLERDHAVIDIAGVRKEYTEYLESAKLVREKGVELQLENTRLKERLRIVNDMSFCM